MNSYSFFIFKTRCARKQSSLDMMLNFKASNLFLSFKSTRCLFDFGGGGHRNNRNTEKEQDYFYDQEWVSVPSPE